MGQSAKGRDVSHVFLCHLSWKASKQMNIGCWENLKWCFSFNSIKLRKVLFRQIEMNPSQPQVVPTFITRSETKTYFPVFKSLSASFVSNLVYCSMNSGLLLRRDGDRKLRLKARTRAKPWINCGSDLFYFLDNKRPSPVLHKLARLRKKIYSFLLSDVFEINNVLGYKLLVVGSWTVPPLRQFNNTTESDNQSDVKRLIVIARLASFSSPRVEGRPLPIPTARRPFARPAAESHALSPDRRDSNGISELR